MPPDMTTQEAQRRFLPGFDVYRNSHLLYHDDLNRDFGVVHLNLEAFKAFSDTVTITQRHTLASDQKAIDIWVAQGGFEAKLPFPWWGDSTRARMEYRNYEHLKIASGFELHLKARLLARDYLLHEIDPKTHGYKALAKEQKRRPINKRELLAVQSYHFNGQQNYLPGLKDTSLKFSLLTDELAYRSALGLSNTQLEVINDYRVLRNSIHLPGDPVSSPNIQSLGSGVLSFLTTFINDEIIEWSNMLIALHKMPHKPLENIL